MSLIEHLDFIPKSDRGPIKRIIVSSLSGFQWYCTNHDSDSDIFEDGIRYGSVEVAKICVTQIFVRPCPLAAEGGNLEVLKALRSGKLGKLHKLHKFCRHTMTMAVKNGDPKVIRYLRTENCPWDHHAIIMAGKMDNLEIFKLLRSGTLNGKCPWNKWKRDWCREYYVSHRIYRSVVSRDIN